MTCPNYQSVDKLLCKCGEQVQFDFHDNIVLGKNTPPTCPACKSTLKLSDYFPRLSDYLLLKHNIPFTDSIDKREKGTPE